MEKSTYIWHEAGEKAPEPGETLLLLVEQPQPDGAVLQPQIGMYKNGGFYGLDGEIMQPVAWWSAFAWPDVEAPALDERAEALSTAY